MIKKQKKIFKITDVYKQLKEIKKQLIEFIQSLNLKFSKKTAPEITIFTFDADIVDKAIITKINNKKTWGYYLSVYEDASKGTKIKNVEANYENLDLFQLIDLVEQILNSKEYIKKYKK